MKHFLLLIFLVMISYELMAQDSLAKTYICPGDTVVLVAQSANTDLYKWYKDGVFYRSGIDNSVEVSDYGEYTVRAYNVYGCQSDPSQAFIVSENKMYTQDDYASVHVSSYVKIKVLNNDNGGCYRFDTSTLRIIHNPRQGKAIVKGGGVIEYVPNHMASGLDQFVYTIKDKAGFISNATFVSVNVETDCAIVYPNPVYSEVKIATRNEYIRKLRVCDMSGRILLRQGIDSGSASVNMAGFVEGMYVLQLMDEDEKVLCVFKLLKREMN